MFSPPLEFVEASSALLAEPVRISDQLRVSTRGRGESSRNWSGAYITPRNGRQFTELHARWEVPLVMAPPMSGGAEYRSSTWIGLDGQRRYLDSSLPQIGTAQFVNPSSGPPFFTWWQWWLRDNAQTYKPSQLNVAVAPGERVLASLRVLSETQVHFIIENRDTAAIATFTMAAPTDTSTSIQARVSGRDRRVDHGASYRRIHRGAPRSAQLRRGRLHQLHRDLSQDAARDAAGPGREQTLEGARLIKMYKVEQNPSRTVTVSKAERREVGRVSTTYVDD